MLIHGIIAKVVDIDRDDSLFYGPFQDAADEIALYHVRKYRDYAEFLMALCHLKNASAQETIYGNYGNRPGIKVYARNDIFYGRNQMLLALSPYDIHIITPRFHNLDNFSNFSPFRRDCHKSNDLTVIKLIFPQWGEGLFSNLYESVAE